MWVNCVSYDRAEHLFLICKSKDFLTLLYEDNSAKNTKAKSYRVEIKRGFSYLLTISNISAS